MILHQVEAVRMYGQTDMKMLIVVFRNFANAPKNTRNKSNAIIMMVIILW